MTPDTKKKFNLAAGSTFAILGLISFAVAAYVASVPAVPKPVPVSGVPIINISSCKDTLTHMGYVTALTNSGGVSAQDTSLEDPQAALLKATAAMGLCKLRMTDFCMGSACASPGLTFSLAPPLKTGTAKPLQAASSAVGDSQLASPSKK